MNDEQAATGGGGANGTNGDGEAASERIDPLLHRALAMQARVARVKERNAQQVELSLAVAELVALAQHDPALDAVARAAVDRLKREGAAINAEIAELEA